MRLLILGQESPPKEPTKPTDENGQELAKDKTDGWVAVKYEKELDRWLEKMDEYEKDKSKVFALIKGQCTTAMKNKLKSMTGYKSLESNDDVLGLIQMIKDLSFTTESVQYEHWTLSFTIKRIFSCKQYGDEDLPTFYNRWKSYMEVVEAKWGKFTPSTVPHGLHGRGRAEEIPRLCVPTCR